MLVYNLNNTITTTDETISQYNDNILIYYLRSIDVNNRYLH
jgi:hypothetical protein